MRRIVRASVAAAAAAATAMTAVGASAAVGQPAPGGAAAAAAPSVQVEELDLTGVDAAAVGDLPDQAPVSDVDASSAPDARVLWTPPEQPDTRWAQPDVSAAGEVPAAGTDADAAAPEAGTPSPGAGTPPPGDSPEPSPRASTAAPSTSPEATATASPDAEPTGSADAPEPDVLTTELRTQPFAVVGFSWDGDSRSAGTVVRFRVLEGETWTDWQTAEVTQAAPDPGSPDAQGALGRTATDAVVTSDGQGLQVWAENPEGDVTGLKAVLVDPGEDTTALADTPLAAAAGPPVITRAQWGANESLRTCQADYSRSVVSAAVHHTVDSNGYSADAVPGILRGIYAYHTRPEAQGGRGWCDIGYNFLVDRFGRVFEGRAGSIDTTVVGVHTGGFNSRTVGVAAIGTYTSGGATAELFEGLSQVIAWKLAQLRIPAQGQATMVSGGGASRYPEGTVVVFPTIYAHRDAQQTTCPGDQLYNALPSIRQRAAQLSDAAIGAAPVGVIDSLSGTTSGVRASGWAYDPQSTAPIDVRLVVDGVPTTVRAAEPRPDVQAAHPTAGPAHGYSSLVTAGGGSHVVCVTALNVGPGNDVLLGCDRVRVQNSDPRGSLELLRAAPGGVEVAGWALDPDSPDPLDVHVYISGRGYVIRASQPRPDVAAAFGVRPEKGFRAVLPVADGVHPVCVHAINVPSGSNPAIGCGTVRVGSAPIGGVERFSADDSSVTVSGWTLDPDTTAPIGVHVYVGGRGVAATADLSRPDVAAAFGRGDRHGYTVRVPAAAGTHQVCVYGIDASGGSNSTLGCSSVVVRNRAPIGNLEAVTPEVGGAVLTGWALDPDRRDPVAVHVYVDGVGTAQLVAGQSRPDVAAAFGLGSAHGFTQRIRIPTPGRHQVCAYAIDASGGPNTTIGCSVVVTR